jgi:hypothetical protein
VAVLVPVEQSAQQVVPVVVVLVLVLTQLVKMAQLVKVQQVARERQVQIIMLEPVAVGQVRLVLLVRLIQLLKHQPVVMAVLVQQVQFQVHRLDTPAVVAVLLLWVQQAHPQKVLEHKAAEMVLGIKKAQHKLKHQLVELLTRAAVAAVA